MHHEWAELREKAEGKREELNSAHGVQTFHIECRETISWIEDKKRILQSTDTLEMDLTGVMTLQVITYTRLLRIQGKGQGLQGHPIQIFININFKRKRIIFCEKNIVICSTNLLDPTLYLSSEFGLVLVKNISRPV